ncbi:modular serine protease [Halyomorpha halys]|uniref:modular serine protease n=1 Tax=Halyomorpha halys TaxID=286706 RepID=UPI0006D4C8A6|nr:modular serine protease-like [Halyomorpha halys]
MHVLLLVVLSQISYVLCDIRGNRESRCTGSSFRCSNGKCIPNTSVCDGAIDCDDRSDETQAVCTELALPCPSYAFRCAYGACVDKSTICNGIQDCADNSDELLPQCVKSNPIVKKCKLYEFQCDSGQCIDEVSVCDGNSDCVDGSDETITQCINIRCPAYSFQCAYGGCIDKIRKCDGKEDCKDGSDEDSELCRKNNPRHNSTTTMRPTTTRRTRPDYRGGCALPQKPNNGNYEVADCIDGDFSSKCRKVPGTIVSTNSVLRYSCDPGYVLPENTNRIFCSDGTWEPEPPRCEKLCKGVHSDSLDLQCFYRGSQVNCGQPMRPGTELKANCKQTYHIADPSTSFTATQCLPDGTWANELYTCVPDCGIRNPINNITPAIKGGIKAKQSEYPWHAGLFQTEGDDIAYICGGTIIHPKAVLTAAHCVYNETRNSKVDAKIIRVVVGKYRSNWNIREGTEQKFTVIQIIIRDKYLGKRNRFEQDIAILDLDRLIVLSTAIMPICFDRGESLSLYQGSNVFGTVVGWGITETGEISEELLVARFPILDFHDCREKADSSFSFYITYDKFCAGLSNGTSVQQGDSGGGLTFPRITNGKEQHFIYGIVSLKPKQTDTIAAFTNITEHMEWIDKVLYAIRSSIRLN